MGLLQNSFHCISSSGWPPTLEIPGDPWNPPAREPPPGRTLENPGENGTTPVEKQNPWKIPGNLKFADILYF